EMYRRAQLLNKSEKASIWQYNQWVHTYATTPEQRSQVPYKPPIVVLLDGAAEFMNSYLTQSGEFIDVLNQVASVLREGRNLGILFAITMNSSSDLPDVLLKLAPNYRIVMGVSTQMEYVGYFSETPNVEAYFRPGSGLMNGTSLMRVQIALPHSI